MSEFLASSTNNAMMQAYWQVGRLMLAHSKHGEEV